MLAAAARVPHLQRLSMDYYTNEKAGVILTRMMSDIEQLRALLQDGYAAVRPPVPHHGDRQCRAVQLQRELALITVFVVVPALLVLSCVVPTGVRPRLPQGAQRGIAGPAAGRSVRDAPGDPGDRRLQPSASRTSCTTATSSALPEANDLHGTDRRVLRADDPVHRAHRAGPDPADRWVHGARRRAGASRELTAFVLYIAAFFQPIQQLGRRRTTCTSRASRRWSSRGLLATDPSVAESPDALPLPPVTGHIVFEG